MLNKAKEVLQVNKHLETDMNSESMFLESLIRQSAPKIKGSIMGKRLPKGSAGINLPWDVVEENTAELIKEEVLHTKENHPKVSLALKLGMVSRNLAALKSGL